MLCKLVRIPIELERRLKRCDTHLVETQRALHRVPVDGRDQILATDDKSRLRTAQQLVAGESDHARAIGDRLGDRWLMREAEPRQVDKRAGTKVMNHRNFTFSG